MLRRLAKFAVAVTVAGPGFSKAIGDDEAARWGPAGGVSFLISAAWAEGEAQERGVVVSDADAKDATRDPHDGLTRQDRIYEARINLINAALHAPVGQAAAQSVTQPQIDAYVQSHPKFEPERRYLSLLRTRDRHTAEAALRALKRGLTFAAATRRYTNAEGGKIAVRPGEIDPRGLDRAIFKAPTGKYLRYGTDVFRVRFIGPPQPLPIEQQNASAWEVLASDAQEQAIAAFDAQIAAKWRPRTTCAPPELDPAKCGNPPTVQ
ncbi:peptidylprolyl isomerase [Solirubrobacter ginsenosidimutans]|uniref:Peptidylprolyl isomerase n=1 Tax=Solirubrobacter ginsenosidimutans TaxID=490573 RepID=A0A9X3MZZ3_9ACTN|nr:peptidylprolyl isomerase [Solirubrobacter ginsenosidimutans]MDA0164435.1 peptidylprolyl isomerase [Solirubrobacter ginsenosidimutans]